MTHCTCLTSPLVNQLVITVVFFLPFWPISFKLFLAADRSGLVLARLPVSVFPEQLSGEKEGWEGLRLKLREILGHECHESWLGALKDVWGMPRSHLSSPLHSTSPLLSFCLLSSRPLLLSCPFVSPPFLSSSLSSRFFFCACLYTHRLTILSSFICLNSFLYDGQTADLSPKKAQEYSAHTRVCM